MGFFNVNENKSCAWLVCDEIVKFNREVLRINQLLSTYITNANKCNRSSWSEYNEIVMSKSWNSKRIVWSYVAWLLTLRLHTVVFKIHDVGVLVIDDTLVLSLDDWSLDIQRDVEFNTFIAFIKYVEHIAVVKNGALTISRGWFLERAHNWYSIAHPRGWGMRCLMRVELVIWVFTYRQTCNIRLIKSQKLNVSHLILELTLSNPLKLGVK